MCYYTGMSTKNTLIGAGIGLVIWRMFGGVLSLLFLIFLVTLLVAPEKAPVTQQDLERMEIKLQKTMNDASARLGRKVYRHPDIDRFAAHVHNGDKIHIKIAYSALFAALCDGATNDPAGNLADLVEIVKRSSIADKEQKIRDMQQALAKF